MEYDTFGAPCRELEVEAVEDSSRIPVPTRGMKIDQRGRREDRDDASISKVVEWFRALHVSFPLSLSPSTGILLSHTAIESTKEGRNMSGAIWI